MKTITANFNVILSVFVAAAFIATPALATQWYTVYETDFSSDPGWITNSPENMYWDETEQAYHVKNWDTGNQYAYSLVDMPSGVPVKLEYDVYVTRVDWAGDVRLGLIDSDMTFYSPACWSVNHSRGDLGRGVSLNSYDSEGGVGPAGYWNFYDTATWYHNNIIWSPSEGTLSWTMTRIEDGYVFPTQIFTGLGVFEGLDRICTGSVGDDYAPGQTGEGYIDNVQLSAVPEPGTLLLLAPGLLGIAGVLRGRKRKN